MGFKLEVKKALKIGGNITIVKDGLEFSGKIINAEVRNPADMSVTIENKDKERHVISLSSDLPVLTYKPDKEVLDMEKTLSDDVQRHDEIPK